MASLEHDPAEQPDEALALRAALNDQLAAKERIEARSWAQRNKIDRLLQSEAVAQASLMAAQARIEQLHLEQTRLLSRLSWRVTWPLRSAQHRFPRAGRVAVVLVRALRRAGGFPALLVARLRARSLLRQQEVQIGADPAFDAAHYRGHSSASQSGLSPARHYLLHGRFQGLSPHPLFDVEWYRIRYPDIGDQDSLLHYITRGRAEDRWPNALFDPQWYRQQHSAAGTLGQDLLLHFSTVGTARHYDPSPLFQSRRYLDWYPDVAASGLNPLAHYLAHGRHEKRTVSLQASGAVPVDQALIEARKRPQGGPEAALFVTHSPDGRLKPRVRHYLQGLRQEGIAATLIVAADHGFSDDEPWLYDLVDGLYVRQNGGWDFACWAHVLRLNRHFYRSDILYWLNDSVIGPVNQAAFHAVLQRVRLGHGDVIGLTASLERGYHVQSFFLAFKAQALRSAPLQAFVLGIQSLRNKEDAINAYEIRLTAVLRAAGLSVAAVFEPADQANPAIHKWETLLEAGFPFLKIAAIQHGLEHGDGTGWRKALAKHGFDAGLAEQLCADRPDPPSGAAHPGHVPPLANDPPQITFVSPFNFGNGLGVAARGYMAALMHLGLPATLLPVERPFNVHQRVAPTLPCTECVGPADLALVHLNPDAWDALLTPAQSAAVDAARHRIGLFVWESLDVPQRFAAVTRRLSAVWVPSRYCADAFRQVSEAPVHVIPYVVPVRPSGVGASRILRLKQELGLAPASRVVLFSFDASSYLARKNPHALVRAFDRSGLAGAGWRLVLKTKHLHAAEAGGRVLLDAVERSFGTLLVDRPVDQEAAIALMAMADIYASPHASEGFGLTIAEAMAMGKPVVASDFGGSTDFLDESCGFPVRCTPWELPEDDGAYPKGTTWGRIDEDRLAETLASVASLPAAALLDVGAKARQRIEMQLSPAAVAGRMRAEINDLLGL